MPVPHPSDNIKTWLAADETHHQVVCVCLFSLTTLTCVILLAIGMVQHYIWSSRSFLRKTGKKIGTMFVVKPEENRKLVEVTGQ